jgi:hypothetical protein
MHRIADGGEQRRERRADVDAHAVETAEAVAEGATELERLGGALVHLPVPRDQHRVTTFGIAATPGSSLPSSSSSAAPPPLKGGVDRADVQFTRVLENVRQGRLGAALEETDRLIARYPNFRLAHLVRGDLLLARSRPIAGFGNTGHAAEARLDELRTEALLRLRHGETEAEPVTEVTRPVP